MTQKFPTAAVVSLGDELLLGEVVNTNAAFLCRSLSTLGVDVRRCLVLPDDLEVIAAEVAELSSSHDHVFTCGGIGPTPDDVTRQAIARAVHARFELNLEALQEYQRRRGAELNEGQREMCRLPAGCELIWSDFPSPPAFRVHNIYVLAGVPAIMESAWNAIAERFAVAQLQCVSFRTNKGESQWFRVMQDFITSSPDVKIGSYPQMGNDWMVELRVRGTDLARIQMVAAALQQAIEATS